MTWTTERDVSPAPLPSKLKADPGDGVYVTERYPDMRLFVVVRWRGEWLRGEPDWREYVRSYKPLFDTGKLATAGFPA